MKYLICFFVFVWLVVMSLSLHVEGSEWGPWDKNGIYEKEISQPQTPVEKPGFFKKVTLFPPQLLISLFQKVISPVDGSNTCISYARSMGSSSALRCLTKRNSPSRMGSPKKQRSYSRSANKVVTDRRRVTIMINRQRICRKHFFIS